MTTSAFGGEVSEYYQRSAVLGMDPELAMLAQARPAFIERIREAVVPHGPLREHVRSGC